MAKKTRLLFMLSSIDIGGAELLVLNICKGLLKKDPDIEIHLLTYFSGSSLQTEFKEAGVILKQLMLPNNRSIINIIKKIILPFIYILKIRPVAVHTHLLDTDRYGQISAFLAGVKKRYSTVHNIEKNEESGFRQTRKIVSMFASKIIFVSRCALKYYTDNNSYPEKKSIVIYNCPSFDTDTEISPRTLSQGKKTISIINIGRINIQKGQIYLIQALKKLELSDYNFVLNIYGGDYLTYKPVLEQEIRNLELTNVFFKGVTRDIKRVLLSSDIMVASSIEEGFHIAVVEAMSLGIPVIATDIPPHREIFDALPDYRSFVPASDPEAIKNAVTYLLQNPDYFLDLSKQEITRSRDFSLSKLVDNYYNLYCKQQVN